MRHPPVKVYSSKHTLTDSVEVSALQALTHRILDVVSTLSESTALNGRELAAACDISPQDVQKVLPLLAKNQRVTRKKLPLADRGRYYYYWMTSEQKDDYLLVRQQKLAAHGERLMKENEALKLENNRLTLALAQAQAYGTSMLARANEVAGN